jgi:acetylglutamate kinase
MNTLEQLHKLSIRKPVQTTAATYSIQVTTDEGHLSFLKFMPTKPKTSKGLKHNFVFDGGLIEARTLGGGSHGLVGEVAKVNTKLLSPLLEKGCVPVISSVANSSDGRSHNINADTVSGELAAALGAEKLILLTDTPGILRNENDPSSLIEKIRLSEARELIDRGTVKAGMKPKVECCIRSLAQGVNAAHIIDGRTPHSLLLEVFTDAGIGTMVMGRG